MMGFAVLATGHTRRIGTVLAFLCERRGSDRRSVACVVGVGVGVGVVGVVLVKEVAAWLMV
jgi:Tfp pilus assembly protein PilN